MTYFCDFCGEELDFGYVPKVDGRGRPVEATCERCDSENMDSAEARRAGRLAQRLDLLDEFQEVLEKEIRPRLSN